MSNPKKNVLEEEVESIIINIFPHCGDLVVEGTQYHDI